MSDLQKAAIAAILFVLGAFGFYAYETEQILHFANVENDRLTEKLQWEQWANSLPLCEMEDGSTNEGQCFWNANIQGNKNGNSFIVVPNSESDREFIYRP